MDLAEIRERHKLRLLETRLDDYLEERRELSEALIVTELDSNQKLRYEYRISELGFEAATLWMEYRKLAKSIGISIGNDQPVL